MEHTESLRQRPLISIRRAGADFIVTYFAREAADWLSRDS